MHAVSTAAARGRRPWSPGRGGLRRRLFRLAQDALLGAVSESRNGRRLMSNPDLRDDVPFCVQRDLFGFAAEMGKDGLVRIRG